MIDDMAIRNMSPLTQKAYVRAVKNFSLYCRRSPDKLTFEDVRDYQLHLVSRGLEATTINQIMCALRFLYGGRCGSLQNLIFECNAFGIVFFEPCFRRVGICKDLEMVGIADLFARVDVDQDCHWMILCAFAGLTRGVGFPQGLTGDVVSVL
jgi:Phage integrase, N-terminal SAM-like domain